MPNAWEGYLESLNWREFLFLCLHDVSSAFPPPQKYTEGQLVQITGLNL